MNAWPDGYARIVLDETDSTNREAERRQNDAALPLWIAARRQTAGRGRRGRSWTSPEGNLFATLLLGFDGPPAKAARLGFHTALAVADTLRIAAPDADIAVKWPNDVLLNGAKASGILLENFGAGPDGRLRIAIGIGINLSTAPEATDTLYPATSIAAEAGSAPAFDDALTTLARRLDYWLKTEATDGFASILANWRTRATGIGKPIDVRLADRTLSGIFRDVDDEGLLVLETPGGMRTIAAGDVFFPEHV